jgi:hypothetical protein
MNQPAPRQQAIMLILALAEQCPSFAASLYSPVKVSNDESIEESGFYLGGYNDASRTLFLSGQATGQLLAFLSRLNVYLLKASHRNVDNWSESAYESFLSLSEALWMTINEDLIRKAESVSFSVLPDNPEPKNSLKLSKRQIVTVLLKDLDDNSLDVNKVYSSEDLEGIKTFLLDSSPGDLTASEIVELWMNIMGEALCAYFLANYGVTTVQEYLSDPERDAYECLEKLIDFNLGTSPR